MGTKLGNENEAKGVAAMTSVRELNKLIDQHPELLCDEEPAEEVN